MLNLSKRNLVNSYLSKGLLGVVFLEILIPNALVLENLSSYTAHLSHPSKPGNKIMPTLQDQRNKNEGLVKASITS